MKNNNIYVLYIMKIGNILNAILVNENIRPAMLLFQELDDDDIKKELIKTAKSIIKLFPDLKITSEYEDYRGIIISKTDYTNNKNINSSKMGEILGYPCYEGYPFSNLRNGIRYYITLNVKTNNKNLSSFPTIYYNFCKDKTSQKKFEELASLSQVAFNKEIYKSILKGIIIQDVYVNIIEIIPIVKIIDMIVKNKELSDDVVHSIVEFHLPTINIFYDTPIIKYFEKDNPIHKGILLSLLLLIKNNPANIFYHHYRVPEWLHISVSNEFTEIKKNTIDILKKTSKNQLTKH